MAKGRRPRATAGVRDHICDKSSTCPLGFIRDLVDRAGDVVGYECSLCGESVPAGMYRPGAHWQIRRHAVKEKWDQARRDSPYEDVESGKIPEFYDEP